MQDEMISFEDAMAKLETIVSNLENGKCSLDDSLKLFEEGTKLTTLCRKKLETAEQRIKQLKNDGSEMEIEFQPLNDENGEE